MASIGYTLNDSLGVRLKLFGALFWLSVASVTFVFVLLYYAQFITPLGGSDGWWQGWYLMVRAYFTSPAASVRTPGKSSKKDRKQGRSRTKKRQRAKEELPPSFATLNAGLLRPYQVVAVTKGKQYVGPKGPGFTMLGIRDRVRKLVDLRKQSRSQTIKATTRDGIQIEAKVTVEFQVERPPVTPNDRLLYPYEPEAIFFIAYADTIDEKGVPQSWTSQITAKAASLALTALTRYALDEVILPTTGVALKVAETVKKELENMYKTQHIQFLQVKLTDLEIPKEIREQQKKQWKSEWQHKIEIQQNKGQAEADRRLKQARARAQIEIIDTIARSIDAMRQENDADLAQIITLRMIEALEEAVSEGSIQAMVPQQIMASLVADTSRQMKTWGQEIPPPQISANYKKKEERP